VIVLSLLLLAMAQEPPTDFARGEREIVRIAPIYFVNMPSTVRDVLEDRGCTVPQTWGEKWPANAIRGHFVGASWDDWAVLCSVKGTSSILVISGGKIVASLGPSADREHVAGILPGRAVFERGINRAAPSAIHRPHDGIEDWFKSNVSEIHYFNGTKWIVLLGAD
jgi:hypothetical protein